MALPTATGSAEAGEAPAAEPTGGLTVYYDGACPLCVAEIGVYQHAQAADPNAALAFVDVSRADGDVAPDLSRTAAMARFHVRDRDGALKSGAEAFVTLWSGLRGWRRLAWIARVPFALSLLEAGYRGFLVFRPALSGAVRRLSKRTHHCAD